MANNASNMGTMYFFMVFPVIDMNRSTLRTLKQVGLTIEVNDLAVGCVLLHFNDEYRPRFYMHEGETN